MSIDNLKFMLGLLLGAVAGIQCEPRADVAAHIIKPIEQQVSEQSRLVGFVPNLVRTDIPPDIRMVPTW